MEKDAIYNGISTDQCDHDLPMLFDFPEDGYYARCQRCGKYGPVRDTPRSAWEALLNEE
jgi:hypothetical protein